MEKIIERLKKVFDNASAAFTNETAVLTVTHKKKTKVFTYSKAAYENTIQHYDNEGVKHFVRGISVDCIDHFMEA